MLVELMLFDVGTPRYITDAGLRRDITSIRLAIGMGGCSGFFNQSWSHGPMSQMGRTIRGFGELQYRIWGFRPVGKYGYSRMFFRGRWAFELEKDMLKESIRMRSDL